MQWDWGNMVLAMSALMGLLVWVLQFYELARSEQSVPAVPGAEAEPDVSGGSSYPRNQTEVFSSRSDGCGSSPMDDCSSSIKLIYPYLDGELDTKGSAMVQAHIRECAPCREAFAAEQEFLELVRMTQVGVKRSRNERGGKGGDEYGRTNPFHLGSARPAASVDRPSGEPRGRSGRV